MVMHRGVPAPPAAQPPPAPPPRAEEPGWPVRSGMMPGRLTDATTLLRDTIARCERVLPPGDPLTQAVRESLTNITG